MNRFRFLYLALAMASVAGCMTGERDDATPAVAEDGVAVQQLGGPGNPFSYVSLRDEQLACYGIAVAPNFPSNCDDISDFNDRQLCRGMSTRTQAPCTLMTDRNLQLACYGMSVAPSFPSNCSDIADIDMRNFCFGVASSGTQNNCNLVNDSNTRALCLAMASHNTATCSFITNFEDRLFCLGVAGGSQTPCVSIF